MKCPFLIKRRDVYSDDGKKVDEDIELLDCLKNECMVYDSATKLCSLLSSNMKTGVLIDDQKKGVKEIKEEIFQRAEAMRDSVSQIIDKLLEGIASRLDVQKKQIEVMILGFDKLQEAFNSKFQDLKVGLQDASTSVSSGLTAVVEVAEKQGETLKSVALSLQDKFSEFNTTNMRLTDDMLTAINGMGDRLRDELTKMQMQNSEAVNRVTEKFDEFGKLLSEMSEAEGTRGQAVIDKIGSIDDVMKNMVNELRFEASSMADAFKDEMRKYIEGMKNELVNLKTEQVTALGGLQGDLVRVRDLFVKSSASVETITGMMSSLNSNYVESLGKIAGLAEGMRRSVEEVSESMTKVVGEMTTETRNQIGAVAEQYDKTLGDVAKLTDKFDEVRNRVGDMTAEIAQNFKDSLGHQTKLSEHTKDILESMRTFLQKEEQRFEREQELSKKKTALDHFDRATLYYYRGNYELALNEIEKAMEIDKTAEYLNLKGLILAELGRYDDSKNTYLAALELEPDYSELHNNLGLLFLKMKKLDEAVLSFEESVKKNVNNALAYVNLGKALLELEKFDDALKAYNQALEIDPANPEAREAIRLYKEGKIET